MIVYLDILFLINFIFDFLILLTVNIALKRYRKIRYLLLGSLLGSLTILFLFIPLSKLIFTIFKILIAIFMCYVSFGYKNFKYFSSNILYFYMTSIILGGFLYYLKNNYQDNSYLYYQGIKVPYFFLLIIAPSILYVFLKSLNVLKEIKNYYYKVEIFFTKDKSLTLTGFLDTGNKLKDPITKKNIIIIPKKIIKNLVHIRSPMYVPFSTLNSSSLLECLKPFKIIINGHILTNYLIGFSDNNLNLNGVECLLNYQVWEDLND